jgi:PAS domain S-box-containing protein
MAQEDEAEKLDWEATFNSTSDLFMVLDKDFRIKRANRATLEFFWRPAEQVIGQHCYELMHGTEEPADGCPLVKLKKSLKHEEAELFLPNRNRWVFVSVDPILDRRGALVGVVHCVRDITERKRIEEALRVSEVQKATILAAIPDLMFQIDSDGVFLSYKAAAADLYIPPEKFLGIKVNDVLPEPLASRTMDNMRQTLKDGKMKTYTYKLPVGGREREFEARMLACGKKEVFTIIRELGAGNNS